MSDYVARLIGRVAHGRTATRPVLAPRFAASLPEAASAAAPAPPTVSAAPARRQQDTWPQSDAPAAAPRESRVSGLRPPDPVPRASDSPPQPPAVAAVPKPAPAYTSAHADRRREERAAEAAAAVEPPPRAGQAARKSAEGNERPALSLIERVINQTSFLFPPQREAADGAERGSGGTDALSRPAAQPTAEPPSVTVRIGRIEVRPEPQRPAVQQRPARAAFQPRMSLDDYLAERREGKR